MNSLTKITKNSVVEVDTTLIKTKNLGGRPVSITQDQVLEIARIKGEYGVLTWKKAIELTLEIHPTWNFPHYKNCIIQINKLFANMLVLTNQKLELNRQESLKKTQK